MSSLLQTSFCAGSCAERHQPTARAFKCELKTEKRSTAVTSITNILHINTSVFLKDRRGQTKLTNSIVQARLRICIILTSFLKKVYGVNLRTSRVRLK